MRRQAAAWALLAVSLAALAAPHAAAAATGPTVAHWHYRVSIPDPASGNVHVELSIAGLKGVVTRFTFATGAHDDIGNVTGGPDTPLTRDSSGVSFDVDGDESLSYDVHVERPAFVAGQVLAHAGSDFALFKAESIAVEYRYSYYEGSTFTNDTTVELVPPPGWNAKGPWHMISPNVYQLPDASVLPRGYVVFGHFLAEDDREAGGKLVHYVRLGQPAAFEPELYDFIDKATPYYEAVYGPGTHEDVLVVNAPDPMFRGGLGGADSFFVHESADLRTVAHEYAHVFQQFGTDERAGSASIWINEGDADYHSALALYAADVWTAQNVNDFLHVAQHDATDPTLTTAVLPEATYGTELERFAYHKGAVVLAALDQRLKADTGGQLGLGDVLRRLNALHAAGTDGAATPVENAEMANVSSTVLGEDLSDFFAPDVYGTKWPQVSPFVPEGQLAVSDLALDPPRALAGDPVVARANVTNRGTSPIDREVDLELDGARVARTNVSLDVGGAQRIELAFAAPAQAGDHAVRILDATAALHTLAPARVRLARATTVPTTLHALEPAQLLVYLDNDGEVPGTARVRADVRGGALLAQSTETVVDANGTAVISLPVAFPDAGPENLTFTVITPDGNESSSLAIVISPPAPPATGDVPGGLLTGGKSVPAAQAPLALALALALALVARRR